MYALVIYDSLYGNTEKIAQAIAEALGEYGKVEAVRAQDAKSERMFNADVVVFGSPTQKWGMSPAIRTFMEQLTPEAMKTPLVASFDTRLHKPSFLTGSAARSIARMVKKAGGTLIVPPQSFFVTASEGPLEPQETSRAQAWARTVHEKVEARHTILV